MNSFNTWHFLAPIMFLKSSHSVKSIFFLNTNEHRYYKFKIFSYFIRYFFIDGGRKCPRVATYSQEVQTIKFLMTDESLFPNLENKSESYKGKKFDLDIITKHILFLLSCKYCYTNNYYLFATSSFFFYFF